MAARNHAYISNMWEKNTTPIIRPFDAFEISQVDTTDSYFDQTLYKMAKVSTGNSIAPVHVIERAISRVVIPYIREDYNNFGGYGLDDNGVFFADYFDGTVNEFDRVERTTKDFKEARHILMSFKENPCELKGTVISQYGNETAYQIRTQNKEPDRHSSSAAIYTLLAYIVFKTERGEKSDNVSTTIHRHFRDIIEGYNACDFASMYKASVALDADIYTLIRYPEKVKSELGEIPLDIAKLDNADLDGEVNMTFPIKLNSLIGDSQFFNGTKEEKRTVKLKVELPNRTVKEYVNSGKYSLEVQLTDMERELIPKGFDSFIPDRIVLDAANGIKESRNDPRPVKNLLWTGETGTGKTTNAQILAVLLGLPYRSINLSSDKLSSDILTTCLPNNKKVTTEDIYKAMMEFPDPLDISLEPANCYMELGGEYKEEITVEDVYKLESRLLLEKVNRASDFMYVDSPFVDAFRNGGIIELQECNSAKAAILKSLNEALDDLGIIHMPTGEIIHRNPNCIVLVTANIGQGYRGVEAFSNDFIARMDEASRFELPDDDILCDRVIERTGYQNRDNILKMIEVMRLIQKVLLDMRGDYGTCSPRALFSWARATKNSGNPYYSALKTIIGLATQDPDTEVECITKLELYFSKNSVA